MDPTMWRSIDMHYLGIIHHLPCDLEKMCRHVVGQSCGQLVDISVEYYGTDDLLASSTLLIGT